MKILIVDYGMGNIKSIESTVKYCGIDDVIVSSKYEDFIVADKIILPGVGAFGNAMSEIRKRKIDSYLNEFAVNAHKPILGICLGMQLLGLSSDENGLNNGLGLVNAQVRKFDGMNLKIPHVGFNQVGINHASKLFYGLNSSHPDFYFTHSYRMLSDSDINQSYCIYGNKFVAAFEIGNIAGVQFHPELSQLNGIKLLKNFIDKF